MNLLHGAQIPNIGLGTWPMNDREAQSAVATAFEEGYRLFDTAESYGNEKGIGRALKGLPRDEVFITTKFNRRWHGKDLVKEALERSLDRLGLDYADLLLIHWPNPQHDRYVQAWLGMAALLEEGRLRAIGTSNFKPSHLQRLIKETGVVPDVNQIELNPALARPAAREFHQQHGIATESWAPLGGSGNRVLREKVITDLAEQHGKTPAQIVLRWHVELGAIPIPKSSNQERLRENIGIFDFELSAKDIAAINDLDRGDARATDSDSYGH